MSTDSTETTFYSDDRGIRVTNSRIVFGDTTYSMANLSSVAVRPAATNYKLVVFLFVFAVIWMAGSRLQETALATVGALGTLALALVLVVSIVWKKWHLRITSSSGESSPLTSRDKEYISRVAQAIQEAMIHRG